MVTKYLDKDGLEYFYNKIKNNYYFSKKITDTTPYLFRKTANELGSNRIWRRCYHVLVGASAVENQLVNVPDGTRTISGITTVRSEGVKISYTGTSTTGSYIDVYAYTSGDSFLTQFITGHRYLLRAISSDNKLYTVINKPYTDMYGIGRREIIYTPSETPSYFYIRVLATDGEAVNGNGYLQTIDLTQKFGSTIADHLYNLESATAGAGIAKLREWGFLKDHPAYNTGSIESVEVTEKKVVGFNQWDEEWELGSINNTTGLPSDDNNNIRAKNYIPCLPDTRYYFFSSSGNKLRYYWYDTNYNLIDNNTVLNKAITSPSNARYFKVRTTQSYGATYNNDICINLSSDRNGEYEPYHEYTYDLGTDTLRGIFKLDANNQLYADGDRKESNGTITRRYGIVDLGTLNWTMYETNHFYANLPDVKIGLYAQLSNAMCSKYAQSTMSHLFDKTFAVNNGQPRINIYDSAYSDAATFKTSMNGVLLVYELATPTTEQSTPFISPQIVYPDGTEEYVTENGVPAGHETEYTNENILLAGTGLVQNQNIINHINSITAQTT